VSTYRINIWSYIPIWGWSNSSKTSCFSVARKISC
jgi:hypothetical protein